ncbi:methyltransferase domain-containing protein [Chloroflexi bacterium TSY]|nr:methyltransferase domain-containing protein [Chloroflexi bacterium TSY]
MIHDLFYWRSKLVSNLTGTILEIGIGNGPNLPHYQNANHIYGIEPDKACADEASRAANQLDIPVTIDIGTAEKLPYPDAQFDSVVSSLVLCSVRDQHQVLNELRRVLKPNGILHAVEHVRPRSPLLSEAFRIMTPSWRKRHSNCHLSRPTIEVLVESGWDVEVHNRKMMFVHFSATPAPEPRFSAWKYGSNHAFYAENYQERV